MNGAPSLDCCKASICGSGKCAASMAAENCWRKNNDGRYYDRLWICLFSARSAIFCRYWTCSFSGRNNQAIGAEVVCIFTFFMNNSIILKFVIIKIAIRMAFLAKPFSSSKWGLFLFERCSTALPCAEKWCMQMWVLAFTDVCSACQQWVLRTYTFQSFFLNSNNDFISYQDTF